MCFSTRQTKEKKELEKLLSVKAALGNIDSDLELIYFHANGWNHPIMWTITQENPNYLVPAMWGIMPSKKNQSDYKEHFKNAELYKTKGLGHGLKGEKIIKKIIEFINS